MKLILKRRSFSMILNAFLHFDNDYGFTATTPIFKTGRYFTESSRMQAFNSANFSKRAYF